MFHGKHSYRVAMPLKTDFDRRAYWSVITHALGGVVLGVIPGALVVAGNDDRSASQALGSALLTVGGIAGAVVGGTAAAASSVVAAIRSRGTGPGKVRVKDYEQPELLPQIPPPRKARAETPPPTPEPSPQPQAVAPAPSLAAAPTTPPVRAEATGFEDYDHSS
jgi:hypothetical protein